MEKKNIVKFLSKRKRGVYTLIAEMYSGKTTSMPVSLALEEIRQDLEKESGEKVELNYFSLAQAVAKFKKKAKTKAELPKPEFKNANELPDKQKPPGTFTLDQ